MATGGGGGGNNGGSGNNQSTSDDYEFTNKETNEIIKHSIDRRTSPIEIPDNATANPQWKKGTGIDGTGSDSYFQVELKWTDNGLDYKARWHTERQGAPEGSGRPWIITRRKPAVLQKSEWKTEIRPDGTTDKKKVITQEYEAPKNEVYLQPDPRQNSSQPEWVDAKLYDKANRTSVRSDEDNILLDRGHWRSDINRR
jgi:hypothetical protein